MNSEGANVSPWSNSAKMSKDIVLPSGMMAKTVALVYIDFFLAEDQQLELTGSGWVCCKYLHQLEE